MGVVGFLCLFGLIHHLIPKIGDQRWRPKDAWKIDRGGCCWLRIQTDNHAINVRSWRFFMPIWVESAPHSEDWMSEMATGKHKVRLVEG